MKFPVVEHLEREENRDTAVKSLAKALEFEITVLWFTGQI